MAALSDGCVNCEFFSDEECFLENYYEKIFVRWESKKIW